MEVELLELEQANLKFSLTTRKLETSTKAYVKVHEELFYLKI